jgi:UDP-N-acetylglucosamine/UDP-N-acetylgalactosamine diphosphorylase
MNYSEAQAALASHGQEHVLRFWPHLDEAGRLRLLDQVASLDWTGIGQMRDLLAAQTGGTSVPPSAMTPADVVELEGSARSEAAAKGAETLRRGEVGVILVAGGQGSRLGFEGPKGAFPVGPVSQATLFEIHCRKILALERKFKAAIPLYIMTSQANDVPTREFFHAHARFGLAEDRVTFFAQGMWPALDGSGQVLLERPDSIFMSPDGHGGVLRALRERRMFGDMERRGIRTVFYFQVDNPLVEVADPAFVGLHTLRGAEMSLKVCAKRDAEEGLGVVVERDGRRFVVEYTELTREQKHATRPDGRLLFLYGSVAIHVFDLAFLRRESERALPLHVAHKKVPCLDALGEPVVPKAPNAYKFEKFIFDVLPDAARSLNVAFDRAEEFSPVKNATGNDSPDTVRRDMQRKFARWFEACGVRVPRTPDGTPEVRIEIDPCYALDADALRRRLPQGFTVDRSIYLREA